MEACWKPRTKSVINIHRIAYRGVPRFCRIDLCVRRCSDFWGSVVKKSGLWGSPPLVFVAGCEMLNRTDVFFFVFVPMLLSLFLILVSYPVLLVTIWYPTAGPSDALHLTASMQAGLIVLRLVSSRINMLPAFWMLMLWMFSIMLCVSAVDTVELTGLRCFSASAWAEEIARASSAVHLLGQMPTPVQRPRLGMYGLQRRQELSSSADTKLLLC